MTPKKKKILILCSKIGNGHLSPAQAIKESIEDIYGNKYTVEIIDFVELLNQKLNNITKNALYNAVKHAPYLYKLIYQQFDKKTQIKILNLIQYPLIYKKIQNFLIKKKPSLILSLYPLWDYNIVKVNLKNASPPPFVSLITDSTNVHQAWLTANADFHIVANEDTAKALIKKKIPKSKIKVLGLPVRKQFFTAVDRKSVLKKMKLPEDKPLLVFFTTAENNKKISKQIQEISSQHSDKSLVVITGHNKKAYTKLKKLKLANNVKLFQFKKNIHELIKSADIVIGKAGGSIVQECICCSTPLILTQVIPGHEEGNASLIRKYKLGIDLTQSKITLSNAISKILTRKTDYAKRLKAQASPEAAKKVSEFINSLLEAPK